jgi:hypothetical protein
MSADQQLREASARKPLRKTRRLPRDERLRRLRRQIVALSPRLDDPKFGPVVGSFARMTLLSIDAYEFLRKKGIEGPDGELRSSVTVVRQVIDSHIKLAAALGLTPATADTMRGEKPADFVAAVAALTAQRPANEDGDGDGQPQSEPD